MTTRTAPPIHRSGRERYLLDRKSNIIYSDQLDWPRPEGVLMSDGTMQVRLNPLASF